MADAGSGGMGARGVEVARADGGSGGGVDAARGRGTDGVGRGGWAGVFGFAAGMLGVGRAAFAGAGGAVVARGRGGAAEATGAGALSTIVRSSVAVANGSGLRAITSVGASSIEQFSIGPTL